MYFCEGDQVAPKRLLEVGVDSRKRSRIPRFEPTVLTEAENSSRAGAPQITSEGCSSVRLASGDLE